MTATDIGLFSTLSSTPPTIATASKVARTSGFSSEGVGMASYIYDSSINSGNVGDHPLTQFLAADGRGFRLSEHQTVTSYMFGAIDNSNVDDAIEAWSAFINNNKCLAASHDGIFTSARRFKIGVAGNICETSQVYIGGVIAATATIDNVWIDFFNFGFSNVHFDLSLRGFNNTNIDAGEGTLSVGLSSRLVTHGILWDNCSRMRATGTISVYSLKGWAQMGTTGRSNNFAELPHVRAVNCGSNPSDKGGLSPGGPGTCETTTWSGAITRSGSGGNLEQTTTVPGVVAVPLETLRPFVHELGGWTIPDSNNSRYFGPLLVRIDEGGYYYRVKYIEGTGPYTLTLHGWVSQAEAALGSGTLDFCYGGNGLNQGGDGSGTLWRCDSLRCGFGFCNHSTYGGTGIVNTHRSTVHYCKGRIDNAGDPTFQTGGGVLFGYVENTAIRVLSLSDDNRGHLIGQMAGSDTTVAAGDVVQQGPRKGLADDNFNNFAALEGIVLETRHGPLTRIKRPNNLDDLAPPPLDPNKPPAKNQLITFRSDAPTISLTELSLDANRNYGLDSASHLIHGTGANGAPTTITVTQASEIRIGATTSGSAVVTLSSTAGLAAGTAVSGSGIPGGTTISTVDTSTQITLSANATATSASASLTFKALINGANASLPLLGFHGPVILSAYKNIAGNDWLVQPVAGWHPSGIPGVQTTGNANVTLTASGSKMTQLCNTALTANRTRTLPAPGNQGRRFRIVRGAASTGAFNLTVQTSSAVVLKDLAAASTWCEVEDDGTEYGLIGAGSL